MKDATHLDGYREAMTSIAPMSAATSATAGGGAPPAGRPGYPLRIEGELEPDLSRWLWLVKWLLAIPHYIVLVFLWIAFVVLTVVALRRDPVHRPLPARASSTSTSACCAGRWRVAYYATGALGTDRYPPFTPRSRPTTRPTWRSTTPSGSRAAWCWSSGGCSPSRTT